MSCHFSKTCNRVDPVASMMTIENTALAAIAGQVRSKLKKVIESL